MMHAISSKDERYHVRLEATVADVASVRFWSISAFRKGFQVPPDHFPSTKSPMIGYKKGVMEATKRIIDYIGFTFMQSENLFTQLRIHTQLSIKITVRSVRSCTIGHHYKNLSKVDHSSRLAI